MGEIKVDTAQVGQIATDIEGLNKKLSDKLKDSKDTVNNLSNTWEGEASQATIKSFNDFSTKFFQQYYDVIDQYVKFLRINVDTGYFDKEKENTTIADAFK